MIVRPIGVAEAASAYRHDMNIYMSVNFGAVLKHPTIKTLENSTLYPALKKLVLKHLALGTLLLHEKESDTFQFKLASKLDLNDNIVWNSETEAETLKSSICRQVSQKFPSLDCIPGWRLWVTPLKEGTKLDFFFHHALFDGTSAKIFLLGLRDNLNADLQPDANPWMLIPGATPLNPPIEQMLDLPNSAKNNTSSDSSSWTAVPVIDTFSESNCKPLKTNCIYHTISTQDMKLLVSKCKTHNTSITALLTTVALHALGQSLDHNDQPYSTLKGSIPRNLRPLIKESFGLGPEPMGDIVTSIDCLYTRPIDCSLSSVWAAATSIRADIQASLDRGTDDIAASISSLTAWAGSLRTFYENRAGKPRSHTLEMSTVLINEEPHLAAQNWYLDDLDFLQGVSSEGMPITCSAISYKGGSLTVSFAWATEIVPDAIAKDMTTEFSLCIERLLE